MYISTTVNYLKLNESTCLDLSLYQIPSRNIGRITNYTVIRVYT